MSKVLNTISKIRMEIIILTFLAATAVASYFIFLSYKPMVAMPVPDVKGAVTPVFELPLPRESETISYNTTLESQNMIIKTTRTPDEIHQFYKNVMRDKGFEIESEKERDRFLIKEYTDERRTVTVITTVQETDKMTIAGIEIKSR